MFESGPESYAEQHTLVADRLGLPDPTGAQDWGIEFSDPERLDDFVAFAVGEMSAGWHPELVRQFVDLLLQSADDQLREDPTMRRGGLGEPLTQPTHRP